MIVRYDLSGFTRLGNMIAAAGQNARPAIARALNHTAQKARTQMIRVLVPQTGLQYRTIRKALRFDRANSGNLEAVIRSEGGDIRLRFFKPREQGPGTLAAPRNQPAMFAGAFMKGGRKGARVPLRIGGGKAVFIRAGASRFPIREARSDVRIPEEMLQDASEVAFTTTVQQNLPARLTHELARVLR